MEHVRDRIEEVVPAEFDREFQLIREAILMVASGGSRRVVVAGIRLGDRLFEPGCRLALEAGVRLARLETADHVGTDLAVERIKE